MNLGYFLENRNNNPSESRRIFLVKSIPLCAFACLGLSQLSETLYSSQINSELDLTGKFDKKVRWTYYQTFRWRAKLFADRINRMCNYLGRENTIDALKKATEDYYSSIVTHKPENTLKEFVKPFYTDDSYTSILTVEILINQEDFVSLRFTECLNAKVFRELNAADIGYAALCHGDEAWVRAYNPKIKFTRTKTLMAGDDCCDHCYLVEKG